MRVFVTGATGYIGRAVVADLIQAGHQVLALSRSEKGDTLLASLGAEAHRATLQGLESLQKGASSCDGVIHLALDSDFARSADPNDQMAMFAANCRTGEAAIKALGTALVGSDKPFVVTFGTMMLPQGRVATERDAHDPTSPIGKILGPSETLTLSFASKGVRAMAMRLPPINHGEEDHGFVALLIKAAREKGVSTYIGSGENRWTATHRLDTARAFRLALEKGTGGGVYHPMAEEAIRLKDIAEVIGQKLAVPAVGVTAEEAHEYLGFTAFAISKDHPVSSKITREQLGWEPAQVGLLEDMKSGVYFTD